MAKFSVEEAVAVAEIQQLINDWVYDLDFNHGLTVDGLVTDDCYYAMHSGARVGRQEIVTAYRERVERLTRDGGDVPPMRHLNANLRVEFRDPDNAAITFGMSFYTAEGNPAGSRHTDATAIADVWMDCRREGDGHWRISRFESSQPFART
ncbi:MAG: nuclear transport factor 2 family protein [Novosphingobium sp.]|nr:nuclear transport factor 2 family protein [Novosphingobium sp.]